jgi:hypothetical protein
LDFPLDGSLYTYRQNGATSERCLDYALLIFGLLCLFVAKYLLGRKRMRRNDFHYLFTATLSFCLLLASAVSSAAQVKRVQMHIGGYLCGN